MLQQGGHVSQRITKQQINSQYQTTKPLMFCISLPRAAHMASRCSRYTLSRVAPLVVLYSHVKLHLGFPLRLCMFSSLMAMISGIGYKGSCLIGTKFSGMSWQMAATTVMFQATIPTTAILWPAVCPFVGRGHQ